VVGRRDAILKHRELLGGRLREQVRTRREHLAELHEHPAGVLKDGAELDARPALAGPLLLVHGRVAPARERRQQPVAPDPAETIDA
jgi:hypothetical protein